MHTHTHTRFLEVVKSILVKKKIMRPEERPLFLGFDAAMMYSNVMSRYKKGAFNID